MSTDFRTAARSQIAFSQIVPDGESDRSIVMAIDAARCRDLTLMPLSNRPRASPREAGVARPFGPVREVLNVVGIVTNL